MEFDFDQNQDKLLFKTKGVHSLLFWSLGGLFIYIHTPYRRIYFSLSMSQMI